MVSAKVTVLLGLLAAVSAKSSQLIGPGIGHHGVSVHHAGSVHHGPPVYTPSHHGGVAHHSVEVHHEAHHDVPVHAAPVVHAPVIHPVPVVHPVPVAHAVPVPVYPSAPPHYSYNYGVQDDYKGTNFGHAEARDGYKTEGVYYVHLPDGRLQTVKYYVDEHGYHPEVTYQGVAHHDTGIVHH